MHGYNHEDYYTRVLKTATGTYSDVPQMQHFDT